MITYVDSFEARLRQQTQKFYSYDTEGAHFLYAANVWALTEAAVSRPLLGATLTNFFRCEKLGLGV